MPTPGLTFSDDLQSHAAVVEYHRASFLRDKIHADRVAIRTQYSDGFSSREREAALEATRVSMNDAECAFNEAVAEVRRQGLAQ
ncbi:hypothetical protein [Pengzhenrongella sicca]|uniref:Uncharacterized protein n=1 Tax=Pengzhenrongella sicca TaxID=2819238 RepID=A0A8A4ZFX4_9MICO|nr:hypothetical protein [Pengzhenrongella sicca]QTE28568.1 hypothetical protein J4E96_14510 [Pengzhenrongella sicca]